MRFSTLERLDPDKSAEATQGTNAALFEAVEADTQPTERNLSLLLVGGHDHRSAVLRESQALVRFDQRPSYWSHVAVIARWDASWREAVGLEVSLDPEDFQAQVPERNGVTLFGLRRYEDAARYPNVCVATFTPRAGVVQGFATEQKALEVALRQPNYDRDRYPLWKLLGAWHAHVHQPERSQPLVDGVPMPSAAFAQSVFAAGGVDLFAAATSPNACPEHIWATLLYWSSQLDVQVKLWQSIRARQVTRPDPLDGDFLKELGPAPDPAATAKP